MDVISEPNATDVICGRGANPRHPGNTKHKELVQEYLDAYMKAGKFEKIELSNQVVESILGGNGRFLTKEKSTGEYKELSKKKAITKTSELFRYSVRQKTSGGTKKQRKAAKSKPSAIATRDISQEFLTFFERMGNVVSQQKEANDVESSSEMETAYPPMPPLANADQLGPLTQLRHSISKTFDNMFGPNESSISLNPAIESIPDEIDPTRLQSMHASLPPATSAKVAPSNEKAALARHTTDEARRSFLGAVDLLSLAAGTEAPVGSSSHDLMTDENSTHQPMTTEACGIPEPILERRRSSWLQRFKMISQRTLSQFQGKQPASADTCATRADSFDEGLNNNGGDHIVTSI